jgi:hypothetical protein
MGKAMSKSDVIYGELRPVLIKNFSDTDVKNMVDIIRGKIGPKPVISLIQMRSAIRAAQADPALKNGRVKVGVIEGDLVWRVKEKNFSGPKELDALVVKNYHTQLGKYRDELQQVANEKARERLEAEKLLKQPSTRSGSTETAPSRKPSSRKLLEKSTGRKVLTTSGDSESDETDDEEFMAMQQRIFAGRKETGMARAMAELNTKNKQRQTPPDLWSKYNLKALSREDAEAALQGGEPDRWLVRDANNGQMVVSYLKDGKPSHDVLGYAIQRGRGPEDKQLNAAKAIRGAELNRLVAAGQLKRALAAIRKQNGFFGGMDQAAAEEKLKSGAVGAWLVRESATQAGVVTWSRRLKAGDGPTAFRHARLVTAGDLEKYKDYVDEHKGQQLRQ